MNRQEFREYVKRLEKGHQEVDSSKVEQLEKLFGERMPGPVQRLLSGAEKPCKLDDDCTMLSFTQVLETVKEDETVFVGNKMVPLAYCGEGDYMVCCLGDTRYAIYNVTDDCLFMEREKLSELFE